MKYRTIATVAAGLLLAGFAHATPFQNGSFEISSVAADATTIGFRHRYAGDTTITGWTTTGAGVDYYLSIGRANDAQFTWLAADGLRAIDLNTEHAGGIEQTFDTQMGHAYRVTFSMAGNASCDQTPPDKPMRVQATGAAPNDYTFNVTGHSRGDMGWVTKTYIFTATNTATTLSFTSLIDNTGCGPALDNVAVADITPSPVPTLSQWALALLATVLGGAALRRYKRHR